MGTNRISEAEDHDPNGNETEVNTRYLLSSPVAVSTRRGQNTSVFSNGGSRHLESGSA